MSSETHRSLFFKHVAQTSGSPLSIEISHAEGVYLYSDDKTYIDCISGISVSNLGHSNPNVIEAIKSQVQNHMHLMVYGEIIQAPQTLLASELCKHLPHDLNSVYYVNSGSEAIEGAMKLAKRFTGRHRFIALEKAYHGSTQGALSLMSDTYFRDKFTPLLPGITYLDQNDLHAVDEIVTDEIAAVFVEPVMGEKGYEPCEKEFLIKLRKRCNETGTLLVFDEIQSGYGRTGRLFAFEHYGIVPDVLVLAKGFGGGMPLGAFISSNKIMEVLTDHPVLGHITTFGGHPVSCAASLAALKTIMDEKLMDGIAAKEALFRELLVHPEIKKISGMGLMLALHFENEVLCRKVIDTCVSSGLLIDWFLFAPDRIRIAPPLIVDESQIREICGIILENISRAMQPF